jgi:hypothetical protein
MTNIDWEEVAPAAEEFLDRIARGVPPHLAGYEVKWTPRKTEQMMADPEFSELIRYALDRGIDVVEAALMEKAQGGNMAAIQMVLFNRRADRWRDIKRIEVRTDATITIGTVESVKSAALALIAERGVNAIQELNAGEIVDGEVIEDGDDDGDE